MTRAFCDTGRGEGGQLTSVSPSLAGHTVARDKAASKRRIVANPDEPRTGDHQYQMYDKLHPMHGDPQEIARVKRQLAGLRGEWVKLTFKGARIVDGDEGTEEKRFKLVRTFAYRSYRDVFGPGSAYASIIHFIRNKYSRDTLVTYELDIEIAEDEDSDTDE